MKKILFITALFFTFDADAQTFSDALESNYPQSHLVIQAAGMYEVSGNAITNKFANAYINNKFIGDDLKNQSLDKMDNKNRIGSRVETGLLFKHKIKITENGNKGFIVGIKNRGHFTSSFTKDLFQLYFYGNKPFAGKTADINNLNYRGIKYQQIEIGFFKEKINKAKSLSYAISLSALNGQDYLEIKTTRGSLFTHADGDYVDMNLALKATQSDTAHRDFGSSNGIGASLNFQLSYAERDKFRFKFSANDLGFISWNKNSEIFEVDTNYHFEGVQADNLLDSLYLDLKSEQKYKDGFKKNQQSKSFNSTLPYRFTLSYEQILIYALVSFEIGAEYVMDENYKPLFYLSSNYCITPKVWAGFTYAYGGYQGYHTGFHADVDFGKGYLLSVGSRFIGGFFQPSKTTGQGAYASVKKAF